MQINLDITFQAEFGSLTLQRSAIEYLLAHERLTPSDVARAERADREHGIGTLRMLGQLGLVSEVDHAQACATALNWPLASQRSLPTEPPSIAIAPRFLKQHDALVLPSDDDGFDVWLADPHDPYPLQALTYALCRPLHPKVALRSQIQSQLQIWYPDAEPEGHPGDKTMPDADWDDVDHLRDLASEAPVVRSVNQMLQRAAELRASDIHIEPYERSLRIRYRIDGVLEDADAAPAELGPAIVSRIKIMAKLDIAERRLPQDGRLLQRVQGRELDMRVSSVPTAHGESLAIRLLDRDDVALAFDSLGFDPSMRPKLQAILSQPNGIVLVTGPTGSGKTTTLYTALTQLNTPDVKIITVEDPVEYQIEGVNQIQVKPQIGLDFAHCLRSIVRQDPDIILVGEMRDVETARIAIQSALTGHRVLSTLHTNSAAGGITRLRDMGVEDYLLTSTISAILAQRLVRRLEPRHAERYLASKLEIERFGLRSLQPHGEIFLYRPVPSPLSISGYSGRMVVAELLVMNDALRSAVMQRQPESDLQAVAVRQGMTTMFEDGVRKALAGLTTLDEVLRVVEAH